MDLVNKDLGVASYFLKEAENIEKRVQDINLFLEAKWEAVPETEV